MFRIIALAREILSRIYSGSRPLLCLFCFFLDLLWLYDIDDAKNYELDRIQNHDCRGYRHATVDHLLRELKRLGHFNRAVEKFSGVPEKNRYEDKGDGQFY